MFNQGIPASPLQGDREERASLWTCCSGWRMFQKQKWMWKSFCLRTSLPLLTFDCNIITESDGDFWRVFNHIQTSLTFHSCSLNQSHVSDVNNDSKIGTTVLKNVLLTVSLRTDQEKTDRDTTDRHRQPSPVHVVNLRPCSLRWHQLSNEPTRTMLTVSPPDDTAAAVLFHFLQLTTPSRGCGNVVQKRQQWRRFNCTWGKKRGQYILYNFTQWQKH